MARQRRSRIRHKASPMPEWLWEPAKNGHIKLTCPRTGCGEWLWVKRLRWLRASDMQVRSCPFCFKANQVPKELVT